MTRLYRIENPLTMQGMWYSGEGLYTGLITRFGDALCQDVPMDFDPQFKIGGDWFSACDTVEGLRAWFSKNDISRLQSMGYGLYEFRPDHTRTVNGHAVFLRGRAGTVLPIDLVWP